LAEKRFRDRERWNYFRRDIVLDTPLQLNDNETPYFLLEYLSGAQGEKIGVLEVLCERCIEGSVNSWSS
jgi:hypothetical protein